MPSRTTAGSSARSLALRRGRMKVLMPPRWAATVSWRKPPLGRARHRAITPGPADVVGVGIDKRLEAAQLCCTHVQVWGGRRVVVPRHVAADARVANHQRLRLQPAISLFVCNARQQLQPAPCLRPGQQRTFSWTALQSRYTAPAGEITRSVAGNARRSPENSDGGRPIPGPLVAPVRTT